MTFSDVSSEESENWQWLGEGLVIIIHDCIACLNRNALKHIESNFKNVCVFLS